MWLLVFVILLVLTFVFSRNTTATAVFDEHNSKNIRGVMTFDQKSHGTEIHVKLSGVPPGDHGLHIHENSDINAPGKHYNPTNETHGDLDSGHIGDLGNITADSTGIVNYFMIAPRIKLNGKNSIINRTIVLHSNIDDLGRSNHPDSKINGNSGQRLACAIVC